MALAEIDEQTMAWLAQIAATLSSANTIEELAGVVERINERLSSAEYNGLYLIDPADGRMRLLYARNFSPEERAEAERTAWDRHPGWVARNRRVVRIDDTAAAPPDSPARDSKRSFTVRSRVWLPVMYGDECVGSFGLASTRPHAFSDRDVQLVGFVCNLTGVAYVRIVEEGRRRDAEARLRASEGEALAARRAAELKDQFVAVVSHELRTPLTAVLGFGHLLARTRLTARQREYLARIEGGSRQLLGLINDILDFSKIEAGRVTLEHASFDVEETLRAVCDGAALRLADKPVELVVALAPALPRDAVGDAFRLQQVLGNIIGNAVKFTERGEVSVTVSCEPLGARARWTFSVRDTGIGIAADAQARLFEPFAQADQTTTRRFGGSGLGLSISRRLAALMEGDITLESARDVGSTFTVTVVLDVAPPRPDVLRVCKTLRGARALVAHRHANTAALIATYLQRIGLEASCGATWPTDAIEAPRRCAVLVIDDALPEETQRAIIDAHSDGDARLVRVTRVGREDVVSAPLADAPCVRAPVMPSALCAALEGSRPGREVDTDAGELSVDARVLVVEDNDATRALIHALLEPLGVELHLARDGVEALEALARAHDDGRPVSLVLMDIEMPRLDGRSATRSIRADARFEGVTVIAMSAHASNLVDEGREFDGYLGKPIEPDALCALVAGRARVVRATRRSSAPAAAPPEAPDEVEAALLDDEALYAELGSVRARFETADFDALEAFRSLGGSLSARGRRAEFTAIAALLDAFRFDDAALSLDALRDALRQSPREESAR